LAVVVSPSASALTSALEFKDRDAWFASVEALTTITFTELPNGTFVTNQYDELGVLFTDGLDIILCCGNNFPNDGSGLNGVTSTALTFTMPQYSIAVDFPGAAQLRLFSAGALIYTSSWFGISGVGNFGGLISSQPFDAVLITDPVDNALVIDDLHFGVPAPGAPSLLAAGALWLDRRHRRRRASARAGCGTTFPSASTPTGLGRRPRQRTRL
jgi:hypothetical protein